MTSPVTLSTRTHTHISEIFNQVEHWLQLCGGREKFIWFLIVIHMVLISFKRQNLYIFISFYLILFLLSWTSVFAPLGEQMPFPQCQSSIINPLACCLLLKAWCCSNSSCWRPYFICSTRINFSFLSSPMPKLVISKLIFSWFTELFICICLT